MSRHKNEIQSLSRRALIKSMGLAPLLLRAAPFHGSPLLFGFPTPAPDRENPFPFADIRLIPHYPAQSPLADVLRLVAPGSDEYVTEKYAFEIGSLLKQWGQDLKASARDASALGKFLDPAIEASPLLAIKEVPLRSGDGIDVVRRQFGNEMVSGRERFLQSI